jgi:hypothetical protein
MLEIILISVAWRKGWRWRALLPLAVAYPLVFMGAAISGSNGEGAPLIVLGILVELVSLIIMAVKAPASSVPVHTQPEVLHLEYAGEQQTANSIPAAR